jgi:hypothetical protein
MLMYKIVNGLSSLTMRDIGLYPVQVSKFDEIVYNQCNLYISCNNVLLILALRVFIFVVIVLIRCYILTYT